MSSAFANYNMTTILRKGATVGKAAIIDGSSKTVAAVASTDVKALLKRGEERGVKVSLRAGSTPAPVRPGQQVGSIVVQQNGQILANVAAVAGAAVAKQPMWRKFWPF